MISHDTCLPQRVHTRASGIAQCSTAQWTTFPGQRADHVTRRRGRSWIWSEALMNASTKTPREFYPGRVIAFVWRCVWCSRCELLFMHSLHSMLFSPHAQYTLDYIPFVLWLSMDFYVNLIFVSKWGLFCLFMFVLFLSFTLLVVNHLYSTVLNKYGTLHLYPTSSSDSWQLHTGIGS